MALVDVYKAMADESRLRILHVLKHGQFNVQELTSVLSLSQPTISHHLKILQGAGIVKGRKEGTWTYYSLQSRAEESAPASIAHSFLDLVDENGRDELENLDSDRTVIESLLAKKRDGSRRFFETVAPNWKELRAEAQGPDSHLESLGSLIPDQGTLLELGCGAGALLERILPRKGETIGVDYSQAMLDQARQNLARSSSKLDLRLGYLEHLPIGDDSVDVAVAYMVLHHIPEPREALRDVLRVLKHGGRFVAVDLSRHENEMMRERYADLWLGFEPAEMRGWLEECGFNECSISHLGEGREAFMISCLKP